MDTRQSRLGAGIDHAHELGELAGIRQIVFRRGIGHPPHPGKIRTRRKSRALGTQDDHTNNGVLGGDSIGTSQLGNQAVVEGVHHLGTVQREDRDSVFLFDTQAHMRNTPKRVSLAGALRAADKASASTMRVSAGSMMPSSQSRAVE